MLTVKNCTKSQGDGTSSYELCTRVQTSKENA